MRRTSIQPGYTPARQKAHNAEQVLAHLTEAAAPVRSADLAAELGLSLKCVQSHLRDLADAEKVQKTLQQGRAGGHQVRWEVCPAPKTKRRK